MSAVPQFALDGVIKRSNHTIKYTVQIDDRTPVTRDHPHDALIDAMKELMAAMAKEEDDLE